MYDINELLAKELFWTKENGRDKLMTVDTIGYAYALYEISLPQIPIYYEEELKELGVPYEIDGDKCLIHDPDVEEYHEITAPFMTVSEGKPKQISASPVKYTGKIPTNDTLEAADSYYKKVREDLKQLGLSKEQKLFDEYFEKRNKDGIVHWDDALLYDDVLSISDLFSGEWGSKYYQITIPNRWYRGRIIIAKAAVKGKAQITLKVPHFAVGQLIGHSAENAKKLARELGVGYVKIETES